MPKTLSFQLLFPFAFKAALGGILLPDPESGLNGILDSLVFVCRGIGPWESGGESSLDGGSMLPGGVAGESGEESFVASWSSMGESPSSSTALRVSRRWVGKIGYECWEKVVVGYLFIAVTYVQQGPLISPCLL